MTNSFYKIVMLPNGDVALQRADHKEEPVVTISFSDDAKTYLQDAQLDVARIMIDAGIDAVQQFAADEVIELMESEPDIESSHRVLH